MNNSGRFTPLFGRILLGTVFFVSGIFKIAGWSTMVGYAAAKGLPLPAVSMAVATCVELVGALMLWLGYRTRIAAWALFLYLIPTTLLFHNFWAVRGMEQQMQMVNFLKNLAIMGGLLIVANAGPGPIALSHPATQSR